MKRIIWILMLAACAVWAGCGGGDNSSGSNNNVKPVTVNGAIVIPSSWAGKWQVTVTFRDCTSNAILSQEVVTSQICPGDTLTSPFGPVFDVCHGTRTGDHLEVSCHHEATAGACQVTVDIAFKMDVNGNALSGSGTFKTTATPACINSFVTAGCQKVSIAGVRLSSSTAGCDSLATTNRGFVK
ncbi:MAG TPA: hypothetical protein VJS69_02650 [Candidatus Krumholzibacteria bacterium]|nr:hypothetical protein [Candidatus Krumholzibacteria bacterium]